MRETEHPTSRATRDTQKERWISVVATAWVKGLSIKRAKSTALDPIGSGRNIDIVADTNAAPDRQLKTTLTVTMAFTRCAALDVVRDLVNAFP